MIVRINEISIARAETAADWGPDPRRGPLSYDWPESTHAYEVIVLDRDEQNRALGATFRQQQLRMLIPETIAALRETGEETVLRLDGILAEGELLHAISAITDPHWYGRYVISETGRLEAEPREVIASLRVHCPLAAASALCVDPHLGLERSVRLRAFGVPDRIVEPVLQLGPADDNRWDDLMPYAGYMVGTTRGLRSLYVVTPRLESGAFKARLTRRLLAAARAATGQPTPAAEQV